jgi:mRNA-degrading endonuclease toxin of MazEF toxin-antitoxin module
MSTRRGEIYWVQFDPVNGSEQAVLRPALIVQNDVGNRHNPTTVAVTITRTLPPRQYPFVVRVEPEESGLPATSVVNCSQLATIHQAGSTSPLRPPRGESDVRPMGQLSEKKLVEVDAALKYNLALT